jgi:hypothetical protein
MPAVQACENSSWTLLAFQSQGEERGAGPVTACRFKCRSWRCRRCAWEVQREDYRRVEAAATSRSWWLYAVLTFDPAAWPDPWAAYQGASRLWDKRLRRRLEREYGRLDYLQTWERTRRGWPHVNLLLRSPALEGLVRGMPNRRRWIEEGGHGRGRLAHWTPWRRYLAAAAPACGFGRRVWVEVVDSSEAMSAYLVKVADEFSRSQFKAGDQRPLGAPRHFRRMRASRGLLPPRVRAVPMENVDERTGEVLGPWTLRAVPLESRRSNWTAVLANVPLERFEGREATWTDVARAREFQYQAAKKRQGKGIPPARFE